MRHQAVKTNGCTEFEALGIGLAPDIMHYNEGIPRIHGN